jgi:hypothetical protein
VVLVRPVGGFGDFGRFNNLARKTISNGDFGDNKPEKFQKNALAEPV